MNADVARSWIIANLIAAAVTAILGLVESAVRWALEIGNTIATWPSTAVYVGVATILSTLSLAMYARLTGVVLASVIPALPQRRWLNFHVVMGAVIGLGLALGALIPTDNEPINFESTGELIFVGSVLAAGGVLLGLVAGGVQAIVLSRAADSTKLWVGCSTTVGFVLAMLLFTVVLLAPGSLLNNEILLAGTFLIAEVLAALIMIPAVLRLRPKRR